MTEMSGLDREVTPQGKATGVCPWYGVYLRFARERQYLFPV